MRAWTDRAAQLYGDRIFHLVVVTAALALGAYTVAVLGIDNLFNPTVWWQSIAVWFAVAVIGHDLILFPLYSLADRLLPRSRHHTDRTHRDLHSPQHVPVVNFVRIPTMAAALLLLMFLPGIIRQGEVTYRTATGLTQEPFLSRWLLITAGLYLTSLVCYIIKRLLRQRRSLHADDNAAGSRRDELAATEPTRSDPP